MRIEVAKAVEPVAADVTSICRVRGPNQALQRTASADAPAAAELGRSAEGAVSFDVFVQDLPPDARTVADIPDDFAPKPIGRRVDIVAGIIRAAPAADFADPTWGVIDGPGFSIEVNIGPEEVLDSFAFHVRGGEEALFVVADILRELRMRAIAPGTVSGFFEAAELGPAYSRWQAYRRQVVGGAQDAEPGAAADGGGT
jgi:hypothetical protein